MEANDIFSLTVATFAVVVALAGFIYTVYSNRANRQRDDLQKVRSVVVPNVGKVGGIMRHFAFKSRNKQSLANPKQHLAEFLEALESYREVRDAYNSYRLSFKKAERKQLDALLEDITVDPNNPNTMLPAVKKMFDFMEKLHNKLN